MKKIIKALEKQYDNLKELVEIREDKFANASEKWQESEKGEHFEDQTSQIEYQADELDCIIDELKELC